MSGHSDQPVPEETGLRSFDDFDLRLGDLMRGERATLGKSLLDVQRELKIKASYIAAIENADADAFETKGFIAGYVRSYARYLGLDPDWAFERFRQEAGVETAASLSPKPRPARVDVAPHQGRRDPFADGRAPYIPGERPFFSGIEPRAIASIAILCTLIGVIGYGGWAVLQEVQKVRFVPIDQPPEVVAELDPLNRALAPEPDEMDQAFAGTSADALDRLYRPKALDVPLMVARDGPIAALDPSSVGALAPVAEREAAGEPASVAELPQQFDLKPLLAELAAEEGAASVPVLTEEVVASEIALLAVRPCWVRVRAADGTVLFEKILDANERYVLPDVEGVPTLRAGNAGSLYFTVNGAPYGPAGTGPSVVKNVPLSSEALTGAYAAADLDADKELARYYAEVAPATD